VFCSVWIVVPVALKFCADFRVTPGGQKIKWYNYKTGRDDQLLLRIVRHQQNVSFPDFARLLNAFGFQLSRINGSHTIFKNAETGLLMNVQNDNGEAKPYQIRQFLALVEKHNLKMEG
jgi:predicted RNA binding protein YcfA (HicA-like mRNA interferase family)